MSLQDRGTGPVRTLAFPNFASTTDVVTAQFDDFNPPTTTAAVPTSQRRSAKHHRRARRRAARSRPPRVRNAPGFTG